MITPGLLAVRYNDRWPDKLISAVTLATISLPVIVMVMGLPDSTRVYRLSRAVAVDITLRLTRNSLAAAAKP